MITQLICCERTVISNRDVGLFETSIVTEFRCAQAKIISYASAEVECGHDSCAPAVIMLNAVGDLQPDELLIHTMFAGAVFARFGTVVV